MRWQVVLVLIVAGCVGCEVRTSSSVRPPTSTNTVGPVAQPHPTVESSSIGLDPEFGTQSATGAFGPVPAEISSHDRFTFDLYGKLRPRTGNLFCSPWNVSIALAMTYAGARGDTADEMARVLHFSESSPDPHADVARRIAALRSTPAGVTLNVANRLWGDEGASFEQEFLGVTRESYGAELARVDFRSRTEDARRQINQWTAEQTKDKINELIPPQMLDPSTRLVLTSAIYFRGEWASKFNPAATRVEPFHVSADEQVEARLMHHQGTFLSALVDGVQLIELPYAGGRHSMLVLLPEKSDGLAELESRLSAEAIRSWTSRMRAAEVELTLPKFTMTTAISLAEMLKSLGMKLAFDAGGADFTGMQSSGGISLSEVVHKAFVDVHEEGTEAAAATAVIAMGGASPPPVFRADRPFVFLIRDNESSDVLFVGRLAKP